MAPKRYSKAKGKETSLALVHLPPVGDTSGSYKRLPSAEEEMDEQQPDDEADVKRRRLCRRGSDEQVERCLLQRFAHLPPSAWQNKTDPLGRTVRQVVKDGLKAVAGSKGRLSTKFWIALHEAFGLGDSVADGLAEPSMDEPVCEVLLAALQVCHHENPAQRTTVPLERFLDHTPVLNRRSVFGLLKLAMEGPTMTRAAAIKVQVSICKCFARRFVKL
jgi:hypothetical protein